MQSHSTTVDGIAMRWEERGPGDPVILLHGIPTCPALWREVAPLVEGHRVIAWEMPGYGASIPEGRDRDISVATQADYLIAWMRSQGIQRATLVGHDLGGGVAQIAAVRAPQMVSGLLLTNAICYDSWPVPLVAAVAKTGSIAKHAPDSSFHQLLKLMFSKGHETEAAAEAAFEAHAPHYDRHGEAEAFVRQAQSLNVEDTKTIAGQLSGLGLPARIVWGAADEFQKVEYGERLAADLGAPLRRIEGGLHFTPEDHPRILADEINALLRTVAATRPA
ncbi:probable oxidoreductase-putative hydrolase involved in aromaticring cleavage [Pseudooceanicola batsensis HTCC2597]|uniref:Probable oxidoreductase-putative hydrolase involved in aromaticring cleavage n=1 Tax=Pseudooceanicola batsensis (strain ATCC BAA-863 / DSM 15984 / KCTC 12145 / HTCC2597) TaxID=252305 RepID=A3TSC2_PSEBH|nr:alpha/beta hydrolase [Pseudooceanicola batsensis]EAQ04549.1 probable oxidoreductase-putative hydrolase involved in aromaticring cleavage [Pseudooceanicola batsensis HTCC2597]